MANTISNSDTQSAQEIAGALAVSGKRINDRVSEIESNPPTRQYLYVSNRRVVVSGTLVETTVDSVSVPGNSLGLDNIIEVDGNFQVINGTAGTLTVIPAVYFGATKFAFTAINVVAGVNALLRLEGWFTGLGNPASQLFMGIAYLHQNFGTSNNVNRSENIIGAGAAIDSTIDQLCKVTLQLNSVNASFSVTETFLRFRYPIVAQGP